MYILDTNVVSELRKIHTGKADGRVSAWVQTVNISELYVSVITVQELEIGVRLMERRDKAQGRVFRAWLNNQALPVFSERILPIDTAVALRSASLHVPNPQPIRDRLIAATALVHGMTVVTRNISDFKSSRVPVLNPWEF
jgi:hypothetical protein